MGESAEMGWAAMTGIAMGLAAAFGYAAFILPTQWLKVERVKLPLGLGLKLLQLSDLHVEHMRVRPARIARLIRSERPDYMLITGDFTQMEKWFPRLEPILKVLAASGVPCYAVPGNHDHKLSHISRLARILAHYQVRLLRNESISLGRFTLVAIDDYASHKSDPARAFRAVPADQPRIVITHDPSLVLHLKQPFDYLLAGHLHGKQFNIPLLFRIHPAGELPARGIYKGLHRTAQSYPYYISKGLSQTGPNFRFGVRVEATVHEV